MFSLEERCAHGLGGSNETRVGGIQIELAQVVQLCGDDCPQEEVEVLESVGQTGEVVEVLSGRPTEGLRVVIEYEHCGTGGAEVDLGVGELHALVVVKAVPHPGLGSRVDRPLDYRARVAESTVLVDVPTGLGDDLDELGYGVGHAEVFQQLQRRVIDALHVGLA